MELQGNLESKNASLASLGNDLKVAEDQYSRLMVKVEEMQNTVASRDNTGETAANGCVAISVMCWTTSCQQVCSFAFCSPRFAPTDGGSSKPTPAGPAGAQHPAEPTEDLPG